MGQRILLFESDPAFADDVRTNFEALGATVDVAGDGQRGLELATAHRPDVILLSIELPGMNGFLVCKKLKKQDGLSDVPLLILSSEATEDVFEQHKKLRTRAEDYIHKPVGFSDLLQRVNSFVKIEKNGLEATTDEHTMELMDLDEDDEDLILLTEDSAAPVPPETVERFADDAIDSLLDHDIPGSPPPEAPAPTFGHKRLSSNPPPRSQARASALHRTAGAASLDVASSDELDQVRQEFSQAQARLQQLEADLVRAERRAKDAEQDAQTQKQRASTAERSMSEAGKKSGASSREFLELREQLNKKDRELLDLREQVTSRDKQIIEVSERGFILERELGDLGDKQADLERELEKSKEAVNALQSDKDGAKKRLEDMKARLDRAEGKSKELGDVVSSISATHAKELDAQTAESDAQRAREIEAKDAEHTRALAGLRETHADELADVREESQVAAAALREEGEQQKQAALARLRADLEQALAAQAGQQQLEVARISKLMAESETKAQLLEDQLEEAEAGKSDAHARLAKVTAERDQKGERNQQLDAQVSDLLKKGANDKQLLARARKAVAIGLQLLEEQNED